jgi:hypothetical protein
LRDPNSTVPPRRRTARWAWAVVLGAPLIALVLILYARVVRPKFEPGVTMQLSRDLMVGFLPTRGDDYIHRLERVNFADCDGDGIPEIGFDAFIRYGGIFEGKWFFLNIASYVERKETRAYSIISGAEVLRVESPIEQMVHATRPDGSVCVHPDGGNGVANCTASNPCLGASFPYSFREPWKFRLGDREFRFNPLSEPGELFIEDLETGESVFSVEQQGQRMEWANGFGTSSLLWKGAYLELTSGETASGASEFAQVFRFHPTQSVKRYTLPNGCVPVHGAFESFTQGKAQVAPDGAITFLANIVEERVDENGEVRWLIAHALVEVQLGDETVVRPIFDQLGDDLLNGGVWGFSGAVACRDSAFFMAAIEASEPDEKPKFRVLTPWLDQPATFTPPEWLPTKILKFKWASVLPDVDADGIEDCLMVWFGSGGWDGDWGLITFVLSGATGQPVRRDVVQSAASASE